VPPGPSCRRPTATLPPSLFLSRKPAAAHWASPQPSSACRSRPRPIAPRHLKPSRPHGLAADPASTPPSLLPSPSTVWHTHADPPPLSLFLFAPRHRAAFKNSVGCHSHFPPFPPYRLDHPAVASPLPSSTSTPLELLERREPPPHHKIWSEMLPPPLPPVSRTLAPVSSLADWFIPPPPLPPRIAGPPQSQRIPLDCLRHRQTLPCRHHWCCATSVSFRRQRVARRIRLHPPKQILSIVPHLAIRAIASGHATGTPRAR
jgi:hypothetical protein